MITWPRAPWFNPAGATLVTDNGTKVTGAHLGCVRPQATLQQAVQGTEKVMPAGS
jgi:hypothetical protein